MYYNLVSCVMTTNLPALSFQVTFFLKPEQQNIKWVWPVFLWLPKKSLCGCSLSVVVTQLYELP